MSGGANHDEESLGIIADRSAELARVESLGLARFVAAWELMDASVWDYVNAAAEAGAEDEARMVTGMALLTALIPVSLEVAGVLSVAGLDLEALFPSLDGADANPLGSAKVAIQAMETNGVGELRQRIPDMVRLMLKIQENQRQVRAARH